MKQRGIKILSLLLSFVLVLSLMPGMTAHAADPYASLKNTTTAINFDGKQWYLIDYDSSTVTLLSKECVGASEFDSNGASNTYSGSTVEAAVNGYYTNSISADAKTVVSGGMFLLTTDQANVLSADVLKCPQHSDAWFNFWWLASPGTTVSEYGVFSAYVEGSEGFVCSEGSIVIGMIGVRPALKLDLSKVTFDSTSNTFTVGAASYTVTWKNDDGTVLETDTNVPYGTTPTYNGATPTKAATAQNTYAFSGWTPAVTAVTGNATYTATYTTISKMRTVTWINWDGTVLKTDSAALGTIPAYTGATPTRPDDASYHYTFAGWSPELAVVTDNVTYTAVFSATPIQVQPTTFTVSFFANGGGGVMNPVTVPANTIYTLPACGFTPPAGKQFKAWQLGSMEFAPSDSIIVDCNAEFVAIWKDDEGSGEPGYGGADEWYDGGYAPQRAWKVKLAPVVNGSAALGIMTGESTTTEFNVYPTTTIYVFPNANPGFVLDKIIWSYIDGTASYDITEAKNFVMPAMDVVVYVTFKPLGS